MISPGDPDEDDDEPWVEEVKINYSPEFHRSTKYVLSVDAGSIYFVFTLKPEHLEIVLAKLGLGKE